MSSSGANQPIAQGFVLLRACEWDKASTNWRFCFASWVSAGQNIELFGNMLRWEAVSGVIRLVTRGFASLRARQWGKTSIDWRFCFAGRLAAGKILGGSQNYLTESLSAEQKLD